MTREDLITALGKPDSDPSSDWLKWAGKHVECTFHTGSLVVSEVRFNPGFNGALANGIKLGSSGSDMLKLYGEPEHMIERPNRARKYEFSTKGICYGRTEAKSRRSSSSSPIRLAQYHRLV